MPLTPTASVKGEHNACHKQQEHSRRFGDSRRGRLASKCLTKFSEVAQIDQTTEVEVALCVRGPLKQVVGQDAKIGNVKYAVGIEVTDREICIDRNDILVTFADNEFVDQIDIISL